jgi:hypothetical protein
VRINEAVDLGQVHVWKHTEPSVSEKTWRTFTVGSTSHFISFVLRFIELPDFLLKHGEDAEANSKFGAGQQVGA